MNQNDSYYSQAPVIELSENSRATFISRTYAHLTGAIFLFTLIEIFLFKTGIAYSMAQAMLGVNWLLILGGFVVVSWLASSFAMRSTSLATQYAALFGFVLVWAVLFVPLLVVAEVTAPGAIGSAALVTFVGFSALTAIVFVTRKDFSFLRGILIWGGILAVIAIVASVIFGTQLGTWFSVAMIGVAGASILYSTSRVLHDFPQDRYVGAALELFSSVALMLWYVLRLFIGSRD